MVTWVSTGECKRPRPLLAIAFAGYRCCYAGWQCVRPAVWQCVRPAGCHALASWLLLRPQRIPCCPCAPAPLPTASPLLDAIAVEWGNTFSTKIVAHLR